MKNGLHKSGYFMISGYIVGSNGRSPVMEGLFSAQEGLQFILTASCGNYWNLGV